MWAVGIAVAVADQAVRAHVLGAAVADMEFDKGRFKIAGTDRSIGILELAQKLRDGLALVQDVPQTLDVAHVSDTPLCAGRHAHRHAGHAGKSLAGDQRGLVGVVVILSEAKDLAPAKECIGRSARSFAVLRTTMRERVIR